MPEVTQAFVYELINELRNHIDVRHSSLRQFIADRVESLEQKLDNHVDDDNAVKDRVLIMETERSGEKSRAIRQGTWVALLASAGLTALWKFLEKLF